MRVLITGSRYFSNYRTMVALLEEINISEIIVGDAKGTDYFAKMYADAKGIPVKVYKANWEEYGKAAGHIRNEVMLLDNEIDLVIAFLAKDSRGTKNMIEQAEKAGVPVKVINI